MPEYRVECPVCHSDEYTTHLYIHCPCPNPPGGGDEAPGGNIGPGSVMPVEGIFAWEETAFNNDPGGDPLTGIPVSRPCPGCYAAGQVVPVMPTELRCSQCGGTVYVY